MDDLVGRDREFAAIGAALRRPDLAALLLVGDAGVGKSHLLQATLRHAEDAGFVTVSLSGSRALADIPLAAFASLLPGRPSGDAGDLVQIRRALLRRAGGRPLLLGLDDAHLLDEASAALAHQLAADLTAFVVGTVRQGEAPPEAISSLMKEGLAVRLAVEPFDREHLASFARLVVGAPVSDHVADELHARTLGNPLFARELLLDARASGALVERNGVYDASGPLPAPSTLAQFVDARLAALDDVHRHAVALLAVGGPLEIELLEALVDPSALVELEASRLVVAVEQDDQLVVTFVHPVYADAARRSLGRLAARQHLRDLADVLEARGSQRAQDVLRIATWRLDGGAVPDARLLADATRIASGRNDFPLAERLGLAWFDQVVATPQGLRAAGRLATAYIEQGRYTDAMAVLRDGRLSRDQASPPDRLRAAVIEANVCFWADGRVDPSIALLDAAAAELGGAVPLVDAAKAAILSAAGRPAEALALTPPGSEAAGLPAGVASDLLALTVAGRAAEALDRLDPATDFTALAGGSIAAAAYAFALVEAGQLHRAADVSLDGWEHAERTGDRHGQVAWAISLGWTELNLGRLQSSARWFERATVVAQRSAAAVHGTRWALGGLLLALAHGDDAAAATVALQRLDAVPDHEARAHADFEHRGRAWVLAQRGDVEAAVASLMATAETAAADGRHASVLRALVDVARLDRPERACAVLDEMRYGAADGPVVDGLLLPTIADGIRAFAHHDPQAMADVAERFATLGFAAYAAECAAGAWAVLRETGGDARLVAQFGRRAQELRDGIDAHASPAFTAATPEITLSRREREIAELVAAGRTSREVADELIIGVRTVESHLARVYAKLGVRSRTELGDALGLLGGLVGPAAMGPGAIGLAT